MAKGFVLAGLGGVAWAVGRSGGPASYPCLRKMRREDRGKTPRGGPVGESDRGGHAGEAAAGKGGRGAQAAGPFWPLPSPEGTRPRRPGSAGCFRLSPKREAQPMGLTLALQKVHHPRQGLRRRNHPEPPHLPPHEGPKVAPVPGHQGLSAGAPGRRQDGGILEG